MYRYCTGKGSKTQTDNVRNVQDDMRAGNMLDNLIVPRIRRFDMIHPQRSVTLRAPIHPHQPIAVRLWDDFGF